MYEMWKSSRLNLFRLLVPFWFLLIPLSYSFILKDHPRHIDRYKRSPQPKYDTSGSYEEPILQESQTTKSDPSRLRLPPGYNKYTIPADKGTRVYISLFVRRVQEIDEKNEELSLDVDLEMRWVDLRIYNYLALFNFTNPETNKPFGNYTMDSQVLKQVWKPDIFIDELAEVQKSAFFSKLVTLNFIATTEEGVGVGETVLISRMTLKLRCDMEFHYYPADTQECRYVIRSYSYPYDQLELRWNSIRPIYLNDPSDPNFDLQISSAEPHDKKKLMFVEERFNQYRSSNYSALEFTIKARRNLRYHLVQTYLPSVLLIVLTWLCFFIPWSMLEARIGISMTTLLTLTAMFAAVRQQSPEVSYTMAIDTWMIFCIFVVFKALLGFTTIYWMKSRMNRTFEDENGKPLTPDGTRTRCNNCAAWTKTWALVTFPLAFILFFVIYWAFLLSCSGYFEWSPHPDYNFPMDADEDDPANLYRYHYKSADSYEEDVDV